MKIAVISDLHLGRGDEADRFGADDSRFLRFLDFLESNFEKIILLGDIFDTLSGQQWGNPRDELKRCIMAHSKLAVRMLNPKRYTYIIGNHDRIASQVFSAPGEYYINTDGLRLMFTHGHLYDWFSSKARSFAEALAWIGGWLRRMRMYVVHDFFTDVEDKFILSSMRTDQNGFQSLACRAAEMNRADIIVTGHTHYGKLERFGKKVYMNSGSCINGIYQFLALVTRAGIYQFCNNWN